MYSPSNKQSKLHPLIYVSLIGSVIGVIALCAVFYQSINFQSVGVADWFQGNEGRCETVKYSQSYTLPSTLKMIQVATTQDVDVRFSAGMGNVASLELSITDPDVFPPPGSIVSITDESFEVSLKPFSSSDCASCHMILILPDTLNLDSLKIVSDAGTVDVHSTDNTMINEVLIGSANKMDIHIQNINSKVIRLALVEGDITVEDITADSIQMSTVTGSISATISSSEIISQVSDGDNTVQVSNPGTHPKIIVSGSTSDLTIHNGENIKAEFSVKSSTQVSYLNMAGVVDKISVNNNHEVSGTINGGSSNEVHAYMYVLSLHDSTLSIE
eukprot:TRINITY_DN4934_c0_g1_i1.p1 TRINITY_DN4934_c0_g1~~TRINITY_DN4934_c0_g1_i1.p1  ORF type:complete len:329 (+),score=64.80 TRINITY_DN4934_c0_g1_i1:355-1341(+)